MRWLHAVGCVIDGGPLPEVDQFLRPGAVPNVRVTVRRHRSHQSLTESSAFSAGQSWVHHPGSDPPVCKPSYWRADQAQDAFWVAARHQLESLRRLAGRRPSKDRRDTAAR